MKKTLLRIDISSRADGSHSRELAGYDYLKPLLETTLNYIGITDVRSLALEGTALGDPVQLAQHKVEVYTQVASVMRAQP